MAIPPYIGPSARSAHQPAAPPITSLEQAGDLLVAARADNTLDCFAVTFEPALRIVHQRTLFGHTAAVQSVSLADGKVVSGGLDGDVKVWPLPQTPGEGRHGAAVTVAEASEASERSAGPLSLANAALALSSTPTRNRISWLGHDDERIVIVHADSPDRDSVRVLNFA